MNSVSIEKKKKFLNWFCARYAFKRKETLWIINYIINHNLLLEKTHFVENAKKFNRGLVITCQNYNEIPLAFYHNNVNIQDPDKIFHEIRNNPHLDVYIQLNFASSSKCVEYLEVLESQKDDTALLNNKDIKEIEELLEHSLFEFKKQKLLEEIDKALDTKNKKLFLKLTKKLKELNKSNA